MTKITIQVPVDEDLLQALDKVSHKLQKARSEVIRQACKRYLTQIEEDELDRQYQQGYERIPEEPEFGELQINLTSQVLPKEIW